jgi:hypothetical protein
MAGSFYQRTCLCRDNIESLDTYHLKKKTPGSDPGFSDKPSIRELYGPNL